MPGLSFPHGFYDGEWQKSPIPFGPSGSLMKNWNNTNLAAGTNDVDLTAVPTGEVWVITSTNMTYIGASATAINFRFVSGADIASLFQQATPVSGTQYDKQCWIVLFPGDIARVRVFGATLGDDLFAGLLGFRIDVDQ